MFSPKLATFQAKLNQAGNGKSFALFDGSRLCIQCLACGQHQDKDGMRTDDINALAGQRADKKGGAEH